LVGSGVQTLLNETIRDSISGRWLPVAGTIPNRGALCNRGHPLEGVSIPASAVTRECSSPCDTWSPFDAPAECRAWPAPPPAHRPWADRPCLLRRRFP